MFYKLNVLLAIIGCPIAFFLAACQSEESGATPPKSDSVSVEKPVHPWDWTPTDAELLSGKKVYLRECSLCHDEGEEGAPALTKSGEWNTRAAKGIDVLIDHAINGFVGEDGKMPARGGTDTLTDAQVAAAVKFMINAPK